MKTCRRVISLLVVFAFALISACGGGGGGIATAGLLRIITDWTNSANPGGGLSEKFELFDKNGFSVQALEVDKSSSSFQTTNFAARGHGTLEHFELG